MNPETPIIRILLSEASSRALDSAGPKAFAIVSKDMSDGNTGRWAIGLCSIEWRTAQDACAVLMGSKQARPIKKPSLPQRQPTVTEIRNA
ncbi:MAG: hypothetical protein ABI600_21290 [Luteolibacter sp.]